MEQKTQLSDADWMSRRLRAARALIDFSQQDLAEASEVSLDVIEAVERMRREPALEEWQRILTVLSAQGVTPTATGIELNPDIVEIPERAKRLWSAKPITDPDF